MASSSSLRGVEVSDECMQELQDELANLRALCRQQVGPLLEEYLVKLDRETTASLGDEGEIQCVFQFVSTRT